MAGGESLLIIGQAGVGKSALLDASARYAAAAGARILRTAGSDFPGSADYAALDQLLAPLHEDIETLPESLRGALRIALGLVDGAAPGRLLISHATLGLFRRIADRQPLLVLVDRTNDLDGPSALVLAFVARRLTGTRIGMLLAEREPWQAGLMQNADLPERRISPLADAAAGELLQARHPGLAAQVRERIVAEGAGNPQALIEYASALTARQLTGIDPLPPVLPLSDQVRNLTRAHFADLPAETRQLLLLAALEETGNMIVVQAAAPHLDLLAAVAVAEQRKYVFVDEHTHRITFGHSMLRTAVLEHASDLERRRAHRALAQVLTHDPQRHLRHLAAAARGTDAALADRLREAAESSIRRGDGDAAGDALTRAAELSPDPADRVRRLLEAAFIRADVTGDLSDASRLLDQARSAGTELADSLPMAVAASYVALNGDIAVGAAHGLLVTALEAYPGRTDASDPVLVDALHLMLINCWTSGSPPTWEPVVRAAAQLRPRAPALLEIGIRTMGDPVRITAPLLASVDTAVAGLQDEHDPVTVTRTALACVYTDRLSGCRAALARVIRDGRQGSAAALAIHATVSSCVDLWHSGQWSDLGRMATDGLAMCDRYGYRRYRFILAGYLQALVAVARGDIAVGLTAVEEMTAQTSAQGARIGEQFASHVRALAAISVGDFDEAYRQASRISPAGTFAPYTPHALWVLPELVEGAVRSGRTAAAQSHVAAMKAAGVAGISSRLELVTAGCVAMVTDPSQASEAYECALAAPDAQLWPFDLARIRLAYGEHLRRLRQAGAARAQLGAAMTAFQRLGARPWVQRAARELRAGGDRTQPTGGHGRQALTPQERRIAELAATGLSNRQIGDLLRVSHRTIGGHLHRIFPKLGVTSRVALRDVLE